MSNNIFDLSGLTSLLFRSSQDIELSEADYNFLAISLRNKISMKDIPDKFYLISLIVDVMNSDNILDYRRLVESFNRADYKHGLTPRESLETRRSSIISSIFTWDDFRIWDMEKFSSNVFIYTELKTMAYVERVESILPVIALHIPASFFAKVEKEIQKIKTDFKASPKTMKHNQKAKERLLFLICEWLLNKNSEIEDELTPILTVYKMYINWLLNHRINSILNIVDVEENYDLAQKVENRFVMLLRSLKTRWNVIWNTTSSLFWLLK